MENETTTRSEFPNGGNAIVTQILGSKEINPKESQSWILVVGKVTWLTERILSKLDEIT